MMNKKEVDNIWKILREHDKRIKLLEGSRQSKTRKNVKTWYKPGGTIEKIVSLISYGFFNEPRTISEIISELRTRDYHLKPSDLTLPLRKIVRRGLLRRTKKNSDGSPSKNWRYLKV